MRYKSAKDLDDQYARIRNICLYVFVKKELKEYIDESKPMIYRQRLNKVNTIMRRYNHNMAKALGLSWDYLGEHCRYYESKVARSAYMDDTSAPYFNPIG